MKLRMIRLLALALLVAALPAAAQTFDWSHPGSSGTVDPTGAFKMTMAGPTLKFRSISTGSIVARYPVTNTYGSALATIPGWTTLWATFTDDSANGSVAVRLLKVDKCSETETQLCSISSSDSASVQCNSCSFSSTDVDFANYLYYIEVTLSRSATSANEQLHTVALN